MYKSFKKFPGVFPWWILEILGADLTKKFYISQTILCLEIHSYRKTCPKNNLSTVFLLIFLGVFNSKMESQRKGELARVF
jgi:hypothetical protein